MPRRLIYAVEFLDDLAYSVMTAYDRDERVAERAISALALEAYQCFEMLGKTTEYGRVLEAK